MSDFRISKEFGSEQGSLSGASLDINAVHFANQIILQIRLNGEMDATYEVTKRGLNVLGQSIARPIAGYKQAAEPEDEDEDEDYSNSIVRDNLADYQVITKLGDANNSKIPVICTQIAELYTAVITPMIKAEKLSRDIADGTSLIITMSSKLWKKSETDNNSADFGKLVFLLQTIKEMYTNT